MNKKRSMMCMTGHYTCELVRIFTGISLDLSGTGDGQSLLSCAKCTQQTRSAHSQQQDIQQQIAHQHIAGVGDQGRTVLDL